MRAFLRELKDINIYDKLEQLRLSNPQDNYDRFITLINDAKEKHLPKKTVKFNKRKHKKSKWMTYGILNSINTKDKLYKKIVKTDIHDDIHYSALKTEFSEYKKILRRSINEAKHLYYTRTFALYKNDIKQTWSVIKDTLQKKHHCKTTDKFVLNNHVVTDFDEIANNFNIYFINIDKSLSDQMQSVASSQDYLLQHKKPNMTFNFILVSEVYIDNVINKLKNKSSCGYDNISYRILLRKLYSYGIRGNTLKWFESYLTDRSQYVVFDGEASKTHGVKCGVPQGSILGPLLFILSVNDICNICPLLLKILYADDTCVLISGNDLKALMKMLNDKLISLKDWFKANKLSVNIKKIFYDFSLI